MSAPAPAACDPAARRAGCGRGIVRGRTSIPASLPLRMFLNVICLCAEWCGTCRDFRPLFDRVASQAPADRFLWGDIEVHDALLDSVGIEIENFPTLVITPAAGATCFAGPVTPFAETLERLCRAARAGDLAAGVDPVFSQLARHLSAGADGR